MERPQRLLPSSLQPLEDVLALIRTTPPSKAALAIEALSAIASRLLVAEAAETPEAVQAAVRRAKGIALNALRQIT